MWVEINPARAEPTAIRPLWDITPKPPQEMEVRVCVMEAKDIPMLDFEGTSDVFFRGFFDSQKDAVETDCHYRCQDGKPSFNYRLIYRKNVPSKDYRYSLQAYDRDFFKSNDIIGNVMINLKQPMLDVELTGRPI